MLRREYYSLSATAQTFTFVIMSGSAPTVLDGYTVRFRGRSDLNTKNYLLTIPGGATQVIIPFSDLWVTPEKVIKGQFHIQTPLGQYLVSVPLHITVR